MTDFKVGDLVECVDAGRIIPRLLPPSGIVLGGLYTVSGFLIVPQPHSQAGTQTVTLKEAENIGRGSGFNLGYVPIRFRLVHRPRADFIEALKALPKELVE